MTSCKILFLCLFFVFFRVWANNAATLQAEEDIFRYPLTPESMIAFNTTCVNLAEKSVIKGNFTQEKYLSRFKRSLDSSGNFLIAAKEGMVWETLRPFPSTMIMGKDFIMQIRPDGRKSVLGAQGNETFTQMADVIGSVFSGQINKLLENFEVYFTGNVSDWNMGLLPRDRVFASFVTKITMSGDSAIRSIRLFEPNDDIITYTLLNPGYPAGLNDYEKAYFSIP